MVQRSAAALAAVVDEVVIVSSRPLSDTPVALVPDAIPGAGPLGGLDAALGVARERGLEGVFLLACDLPLVDGDLVRRVLDRVGDAAAAAPERPGGGVEATCAVYRVGVSPAVDAALASDDRSLHALFRDVGGVVLSLEELGAVTEDFLNVNTPADLERAETALASRAGRSP